ncbi:MAG TPA: LysR family transcriptional regulator [Archangium sp.]|nr:LysR family transcriptional regulator [Archangium sp.]
MIHAMKLSAYDLNHVRALHALLEEAHVARAAQRLGISAPACSNALRRLRSEFEDPLLVRTGRTLARTALAEALREPAREVVQAAERLLSVVRTFEPQTFEGELTLTTSDHVLQVLLGPLEARLSRLAPRANLRIRPIPTELEPWLRETGDLALGPFEAGSAQLSASLLFEDVYVCLMRQGHARSRGRWTLEDYARATHVLATPRGTSDQGTVDEALRSRGLTRRVARTVPTFSSVPWLLLGSDSIATLPASCARAFAEQWRLVIRPPPLPLPAIPVRMLWHRRHEHDARHQWLRQLIQDSAREMPGGTGART